MKDEKNIIVCDAKSCGDAFVWPENVQQKCHTSTLFEIYKNNIKRQRQEGKGDKLGYKLSYKPAHTATAVFS